MLAVTPSTPETRGLPVLAPQADDVQQSDVEITLVRTKVESIDLLSDDSDSEINAEKLFRSADPVLNQILNPRRRISKRQPCAGIKAVPMSSFGFSHLSLTRLTSSSSSSISPKSFRDLQAKFKLKGGKKKKKKTARKKSAKDTKKKKNDKTGKTTNKKGGQKSMPSKTEKSKAGGAEDRAGAAETHGEGGAGAAETRGAEDGAAPKRLCAAFLKREHSTKYHAAYVEAKQTKTECEAKLAAQVAGRARTADLRQRFEDGWIDYKGQVVKNDVD